MKFLPRSRTGRTSLIISTLLMVSAFVPLPLPLDLVNKAIALRAPKLELQASAAHITWGRGTISLVDLRLKHEQQDRLRIEQLDVALDLWPGSATFGKPVRLHVMEADGQLQQAVLDSLSKLRSKKSTPFPLAIEISNSALRWTDTANRDYLIEGVRAYGHMSPEGARFEVHGNMQLPASGGFQLRIGAGAGLHDWQLSLSMDAVLARDWPGFALDGARWNGARFDLQAYARGHDLDFQDVVIDGTSSLASFRADQPRLYSHDIKAQFNGDLASGLRIKATGSEEHGDFAMEMLAALDAQKKPELTVEVVTTATEVNAETLTWLSEILPDVGDILLALEPRGKPVTAFDCSWSEAAGFAWNLHVNPNGTNITYRGILDEEGKRFSFPYPATNSQGSVVACKDAVLFYGGAQVGGTGAADSTGIIDFRNDGFLAIDLEAVEIPLDQRISSAMTGNPVIADVWRQLGTPNTGLANVELQIRFQEKEFFVRVAGDGGGMTVQPGLLPISAEVDHAWFEWVPGIARFGASMNALGGGLWLDGNLREVANRELPDIRLTLRGRGFDATQSELRILESYLPLPKGLSEFDLSGNVFYDLHLVQPLDGSPGHISGQLIAEGANLRWPAMGLDFNHLVARASFAGHGEDMQIGVARSWSQVDGGTLEGSLSMSSASPSSQAVAAGHELDLNNELLANLQALSGQKPWGNHLDWSGTVDMLAMVDPFHPDVIDSHLDFHPLRIGIPKVPGAETEDLSFELQGRIGVNGIMTAVGSNFPQFKSHALTFNGTDVDLAVLGLRAHFDDTGLQLNAVCDSATGIALSSRLPLLVDEETMAALGEIGLTGTVRPAALKIQATLPYAAPLRFTAEGGLIMENVAMTGGGSQLTEGSATIAVHDAHWAGPQDFSARLEFENGSADVAGLALRNAKASVALTPEGMHWTDLDAETLGGRLHTNGASADGIPVHGSLRFDFDPSAPVQAEYFVTGLQLERMRDELGLGGPLAGVVNGYVQVAVPTSSPAFAEGRGWFHVNGGALGTVPVLKSIFRFAGISPPIFDEGDIHFRLNGNGKLDIDEFSLQHPLLRVTGKGSMSMDTRLSLKVTLRTFGFLGRLPVIKDLVDLLIEQQVYGPAEAPVITHRASGKLLGDNFKPPPFPLWVPAAAQPNWRISPIFPVE
mgnify:CR=1 FL=1